MRPTAQQVATALLRAADVLNRTKHTLEGSSVASLAPQRLAVIEHMEEEDIEEALLATDVELVHSSEPPPAGLSSCRCVYNEGT